MFNRQTKKKPPPPRPPPPNIRKYKSRSTYNLATSTNVDLIEWSPPNSPKVQNRNNQQQFGSVSSSYSSSTSSLSSGKKSSDYDYSPINWVANSDHVERNARPTIIRAQTWNRNKHASPPTIPPPDPPTGVDHSIATAYGVALYDYPSSHPSDLSLQVNDVVILIKRINNEWLYGQVNGREGMFPENFIRIIVPLSNDNDRYTVLYDFVPQMADDLELKAGQNVRVLKEISDDWLYGECNGKTGQFPRNFIDNYRVLN